MAIKVKLLHTDLTLKQIADEMAFPNPSFFTNISNGPDLDDASRVQEQIDRQLSSSEQSHYNGLETNSHNVRLVRYLFFPFPKMSM